MSAPDIRVGDCLDVLRTLDAESVQCCVTSPPYFGLRDYGTANWVGGSPDCDHSPERRGGRFAAPVSAKQASNVGSGTASQRHCPCGAERVDSQIGLEPTPDEYVAKLVEVFREVRRVLKDDGTLWLNLGDSYASGETGRVDAGKTNDPSCGANKKWDAQPTRRARRITQSTALPPKNLLGIPWRVAFALQADGWYLRSDIIWHKPNPMPESVTDRPTKAHEYLFLLSKSERYYYDAPAISEPFADERMGASGARSMPYSEGAGRRDHESLARGTSTLSAGPRTDGRNRRTVWTVATQPYSGAHFATFPPALIEPCILAGSRVGDTVLDPFGGAGTTGLVADRLSRNALLIELNPEYAELARRRIFDDAPLFGGAA